MGWGGTQIGNIVISNIELLKAKYRMAKVIKGVNDFATNLPDAASEWHPTLNGSVTPDEIALRSNKDYYWLCKKGHTYILSPDKRFLGQGCYYCSNRRLLVGFNDLKTVSPEDADEWDYEKNPDSPEDYTYVSYHKAYWVCKECGHKWQTTIRAKVQSEWNGCKKCAEKRRGKRKAETAAKKTGGITDTILIKEWDYEKNDKEPSGYSPNSSARVHWICSTCGYAYEAKIANRAILHRGCPVCSNKVVWPGHNDLATTHPDIAAEWDYEKNGDLTPRMITHGSGKQVWWRCPVGHSYRADPLHRTNKDKPTGCSVCFAGRQTSFAEQAVYYYVKKLYPDAESRSRSIFDNSMELDIYIPSIRIGIEYDGEAWHGKNNRKAERENRKYQICKKKGIKLIRLREKKFGNEFECADFVIQVDDMYLPENLQKVITGLLANLDPESNMWTRKHFKYFSDIDVDIKRDEKEIREYMTRVDGSLEERYPEIAAEWHPTLNGTVTPDMVKPKSDIKYYWLCPICGNEYDASPGHRIEGTGCPECGRKKRIAKRRKSVVMIDPDTGVVIKRFESIRMAHQETGISESNISSVCKGNRSKAGGYCWQYEDRYY